MATGEMHARMGRIDLIGGFHLYAFYYRLDADSLRFVATKLDYVILIEVMSITRRTLGRNLLAGAALSPFAPLIAQGQGGPKKVRYCIVGLGRISLGHFMPACKISQKAEVVALVSGHREKAEKYAAEYNVPTKNIYSYSNYDEIAGNKDIDAVYIALPNSMHAEYTIRAANADKHVLCEKPMATSACGTANR